VVWSVIAKSIGAEEFSKKGRLVRAALFQAFG